MKEYTEQELAEYDGKNGRSAYLAHSGKVYDFSSFLWKMEHIKFYPPFFHGSPERMLFYL